ncbi:phage holin family protein [Endozoicomonas arenosclerae]|uniref:phage holin family protein n=1 Tax=Endozoicomonas arenosclerae TaxID=1633495 RepID=UPI0007835B3E|nr:phage holin family protein [Endozoicomonas arenosclerae]
MNEHTEWLEHLIRLFMSFVPVSILAWIGGTAKYLHDLQSGRKKHSWPGYLISSVMCALTGIIVGEFIPETMQMRDGLIAMSGVCAFQLLTVLEDTGTGVLKKVITREGEK